MKTTATVACAVLMSLSACAVGSTPDLASLEGDGGVATTGESDSGSAPIFIDTTGTTTGSGTGSTGTTGSTGGTGIGGTGGTGGTGGVDAGSNDFGFDAGTSGFDAGSGGFGVDSGDFGFDAGSDDFDAGGGSTCEGYASPNTTADCYCTASDQSECQANGCYGGYYCDTSTEKCKEYAPSGC